VEHARTLALDVGDRRIGLAITDELGLTAQPLFTLHRAGKGASSSASALRADVKAVGRFIRQHKVEVVVVGNPLHADGTASEQSAKALAFAAALKEAQPALEHHLLDERLTTRAAHALLDEAGRGRRSDRTGRLERQEIIDQVAAVLLLEAFLSGGKPVLLPDPDAALED
jgi:putative Holliday junction resolvase